MRISVAVAATALGMLALAGCSSTPTAEVGDCLALDMNASEVGDLNPVDCATSHTAEVFHKFTSELSAFDLNAVWEESDEQCYNAFESYIGSAYETSMVDFSYIYPTSQTWAAGDRETICLAYEIDENYTPLSTTGSLKGSGK